MRKRGGRRAVARRWTLGREDGDARRRRKGIRKFLCVCVDSIKKVCKQNFSPQRAKIVSAAG